MPLIGPDPAGLLPRFEVLATVRAAPGAVVLGVRDTSTGAEAFLKAVEDGLAGPAAVARLAREADLLARLGSARFPPLLARGRTPDGWTWLATGKLPGQPLAELLAARAPLSLAESLWILEGLLEALAGLHAAGLVHRDVTPANVLVDAGHHVGLVDLGLAGAEEPGKLDRLTRTGEILGTPRYMAPERGLGEKGDARADLYAAGLVLFECLVGEPAFPGTDPWGLLVAQVEARVPAPGSLVRGIPPELDAALARALEKDPALRYPSATDFAAALRRAVEPGGEPPPEAGTRAEPLDPPTPTPTPTPVRRLDRLPPRIGPYELIEILGMGGMGAVCLARHRELDRTCALKLVLPHVAANPVGTARFLREGQLQARLSHPNLVRVFDAGFAEGLHYLAMERVLGETLLGCLRRHPILDPGEAAWLGLRLLDALAYLHAQGLVHRDVKPANLMVARDGSLKLMDLGIVLDTAGTRLTASGLMVGTLFYLAPEQAMGRPVDGRADQFSWAMVVAEAMLGAPLRSGAPADLVRSLERRDSPIAAGEPLIPGPMREVLRRATAPHPGDRFPETGAVQRAWAAAAAALVPGPGPGRLAPEAGRGSWPVAAPPVMHLVQGPGVGSRIGVLGRAALAAGLLLLVLLVPARRPDPGTAVGAAVPPGRPTVGPVRVARGLESVRLSGAVSPPAELTATLSVRGPGLDWAQRITLAGAGSFEAEFDPVPWGQGAVLAWSLEPAGGVPVAGREARRPACLYSARDRRRRGEAVVGIMSGLAQSDGLFLFGLADGELRAVSLEAATTDPVQAQVWTWPGYGRTIGGLVARDGVVWLGFDGDPVTLVAGRAGPGGFLPDPSGPVALPAAGSIRGMCDLGEHGLGVPVVDAAQGSTRLLLFDPGTRGSRSVLVQPGRPAGPPVAVGRQVLLGLVVQGSRDGWLAGAAPSLGTTWSIPWEGKIDAFPQACSSPPGLLVASRGRLTRLIDPGDPPGPLVPLWSVPVQGRPGEPAVAAGRVFCPVVGEQQLTGLSVLELVHLPEAGGTLARIGLGPARMTPAAVTHCGMLGEHQGRLYGYAGKELLRIDPARGTIEARLPLAEQPSGMPRHIFHGSWLALGSSYDEILALDLGPAAR